MTDNLDNLVDVDSEKVLDKLAQDCLDRINTASSLRFTIETEGWKILLDTFEQMKQDQLEELSRQPPGDDKAILAAHSVWYSVVHTLDQIQDSVNSAIQDGYAAQQTLAEIAGTRVQQETEDE